METVLPLRTNSARGAGFAVVHEHSPTVAEDPMGIAEKANGNAAVVGVTVVEDLPETEDAVIAAQISFASLGLRFAMGAVGGEQGLERLRPGAPRRSFAHFIGQTLVDRRPQQTNNILPDRH